MRADLNNLQSLKLSPSVGTTSMKPVAVAGPQGADGSNVLPTDVAVAQRIEDPASATAAALLVAQEAQLAADVADPAGVIPTNFLRLGGAASAGAKNLVSSPSTQIGAGSDVYVILGGSTAFPHVIAPGTSLPFLGGGYDTHIRKYPGAANPAILSVGMGAHHVFDAPGGHGHIGGGSYSALHQDYSVICGGTQNTSAGPSSFQGGGRNNRIGVVVTALNGAHSSGAATITTTLGLTTGHKVFIGLGKNSQSYGIASVAGTVATLDRPLDTAWATGALVVTSDGTSADAAVLVGGSSNLVNKTYGTLVGGFNNKVQGIGASIVGGTNNAASGNYSFLGGGDQNNVTGAATYGVVCGGSLNTASGQYSAILGGSTNTASGKYSVALGNSAVASRFGEVARGGGGFAVAGDRQASAFISAADVTGAVTQQAFLDVPTTQQLALPGDNSGLRFVVEAMAWNRTDHTIGGIWTISGGISRGAGAASTVLFGTPIKDANPSNVAGLDVNVSADTTTGALRLDATGIAIKRHYFTYDTRVIQTIG